MWKEKTFYGCVWGGWGDRRRGSSGSVNHCGHGRGLYIYLCDPDLYLHDPVLYLHNPDLYLHDPDLYLYDLDESESVFV